jgi:putative SOS response-associated peptidase YedK
MCGRYVLSTPGDVLAELFQLPAPVELAARYNIAPTQAVPIVRASVEDGRELAFAQWGLVPHWAKERAIGNRLINARGETLAEKPSFRDAFKRRRCLIPADGFYEWRKVDGGKQPYLLRLRGGALFAFAGLWSTWRDRERGETLESCAIVTTSPNALAATIHDRMPVILPPERHARWLDPAATDPVALASLLVPYPDGEMEAYPVSTRVNSPRNDDPSLIEPAG